MAKKILILGVAIIMALGLFIGCGGDDDTLPYNARIIHLFTDEPFKEEFLIENRILNVSYDIDENEPITTNEPLPPTRTFIVLGQDEYEQIFKISHPEAIDFETEMLIICTFGYSDSSGNFLVKGIDLNGETLSVFWKNESVKGKSGNNAMIPPRQRWIVLQMDKLDISSTEFAKG